MEKELKSKFNICIVVFEAEPPSPRTARQRVGRVESENAGTEKRKQRCWGDTCLLRFFELVDFTGGQSCGTGVTAWLIHTNSLSVIISRAPFALKTILARVIKYRLIQIQYLIQE